MLPSVYAASAHPNTQQKMFHDDEKILHLAQEIFGEEGLEVITDHFQRVETEVVGPYLDDSRPWSTEVFNAAIHHLDRVYEVTYRKVESLTDEMDLSRIGELFERFDPVEVVSNESWKLGEAAGVVLYGASLYKQMMGVTRDRVLPLTKRLKEVDEASLDAKTREQYQTACAVFGHRSSVAQFWLMVVVVGLDRLPVQDVLNRIVEATCLLPFYLTDLVRSLEQLEVLVDQS